MKKPKQSKPEKQKEPTILADLLSGVIEAGVRPTFLAKLLGVQYTTLWRWAKRPKFPEANLSELQRDILNLLVTFTITRPSEVETLNSFICAGAARAVAFLVGGVTLDPKAEYGVFVNNLKVAS